LLYLQLDHLGSIELLLITTINVSNLMQEPSAFQVKLLLPLNCLLKLPLNRLVGKDSKVGAGL
jgi:hypothetical protein